MRFSINITGKSLNYAFFIFLGALVCWKGLVWLGISDPMWSVITVILVTDPDLSTTITLSKVRVINTIVGCLVGVVCLLIFGYHATVSLIATALVILAVTSIENYPANWRLAPVTVLIVMNAARSATNYHDEIAYAVTRACEIFGGCLVAFAIAFIRIHFTRLFKLKARFKDWE